MALGHFNRTTRSYEKYKAHLNALFDGKAKANNPKAVNNPKSARRLSGTPTFSYEIYMEAIKRSTTPDEVTRTINAFLEAGHQIPYDEDILSKSLIHRDEGMVLTMLQKLKELLQRQEPRSPRLLKTRLENLLLLSPSLELKTLAAELQDNL